MIKDLRDWKKESERKNRNKHQWGWFQHPNAGNVEYNIDFFNHVTGADGGDTSVLAGSVGDGGMGESLAMNDTVELYYDDIEVSGYYGPTDWETGYPEKEYNETVSWVYTVDRDDIFVDLEEFIAEESPELSDGQLEMIVSENFEELVDKYYQQLLDKYRKYAEEDANEKYEYDEYDHYLDAIGESVNIREALNKIDCNTCGKYDLLNMYDCSDMPVEKKAKLAEMLKENVSADKLYEYMNEESPWQIGLELFADNGKEYKVISVLDEREVDGYELSIVGAIGNELSNADEEVYFVLLDSDIEWGPVDTAQEAIEWASDVRDGYYSDDEDDFDSDDDIDFIDLYGVHGEYDDDYGVQKRHSMNEDTDDSLNEAEDNKSDLEIEKNKDVEKLVFNDINTELRAMKPDYNYTGDYDYIRPYDAWINSSGYWYLEDNYNYHKWHDKQNLILHYKGYKSLTQSRLKAIARAIKNIGGKYITIKYGQVYFYLDLTKYFEKDNQAKQQAEQARKEKLMSIDVEKYRPSDALIAKAKQYYLTNSTRFVRKIDDIDTYLTYYYLSQLLNWNDLADVIKDKASSLDRSKYYDIEDAIDLKVKPEKIDRGNSAFVSNFSNVVKFCIDNNIQWKATSRRATPREYEKDTRNGAIYTIAYDFEVNGQTLPVAIHTDEGGGRPYGYMIDNNMEVSGIRQATSIIIDWIKKVANINESYSDDWSDTLETGGEPSYCPDCSVRFVRDEEGNAVCPECKRTPHQIEMDKRKDESLKGKDDTFGELLDEDTIKQGKHWVNKGKAGTHGKFTTKKEADAQRKAMFANGYKESIKEACRRGNAMNEGAMKEIDLEVQEAGGVDAYIDSLESQLRNISREMRFLRGQARREMKAGGAYDSVDEINDALKATEREYNEVRKKYDYISSQQTGGVN